MIAVILTFALWAISMLGFLDSGTIMDYVMAFLVIVIFGFVSYFLGSKRIFVYSLLMACLLFLTGTGDPELASVIMMVIGTLISLIGFALMAMFLRRYPGTQVFE